MRPFLLPLLVALAVPAGAARAQMPPVQSGTLPSFASDAALRSFVVEVNDSLIQRQRRARGCSAGGAALRKRIARTDKATAVLAGSVADAKGAPLSSVAIRVESMAAGALSSDGTWHIEIPAADLAEDSIVVSATMIGYDAPQLRLSLAAGDSVQVDFSLCPQPVYLSEVTVTGAAAGKPAPSITNVQHEGVDEGGIVKLHGHYLVVLRRGRLFTVNVGRGRLESVSTAHAYGPDMDPRGTWYDELLIAGNDVVVIGYSYARGGTEIGLFRIDDDGRLAYRATYHLRSGDYYSSRNYASRLVNGRLVLYAPIYLPRSGDDLLASLPALRRWHAAAREDDFHRIMSSTRIYRSAHWLDPEWGLTLHTVTVCDVQAPELTCDATGVLGPSGRVSYVSPRAFYVWVSGWPRGRRIRTTESMLYRIPLDGSAPTAVQVKGTPTDQFSFLESRDDYLNVLVRGRALGEGMWRAEWARGNTALLRIPLTAFSDGSSPAPAAAYRALYGPADGYAFHNRFVGNYLLYGTGSGWGPPRRTHRSTLYAVRWSDGSRAALSLPHGIDRIEPMGSDAVVIGTDGEDLHFTDIDLAGLPAPAGHYVRPEATQGELRSHGFFYRPTGPASGLLGLPIRGAAQPGWKHLVQGSASVVFLENDAHEFHELGELEPKGGEPADDACIASCVDWYGNARPLFLGRRVFALLGYEIVEGTVEHNRIREIRRIDFTPAARPKADRR